MLHTGVLGRSPSQPGLPSYKMTKLCTSTPSVLLGVSNVGHQTHWSLQHSSSFPPQGLCTCGSFSSPILRRSLLLQAILSQFMVAALWSLAPNFLISFVCSLSPPSTRRDPKSRDSCLLYYQCPGSVPTLSKCSRKKLLTIESLSTRG